MCVQVSGAALAQTATAVEYFSASLNHYVVTANPAEVAALDAGTTVTGWARTGGEFTVWTDPGPGRAAVCRLFGTPGAGRGTRFYTTNPDDCAGDPTLTALTSDAIAFYISLPVGNACPSGTQPLYPSLYSSHVSGADYRLTVDLTAHTRMTRSGHPRKVEGAVMCAPLSDAEIDADIVRLGEQATLGPTEAFVAEVKSKGIAGWVDEQLKMNVTRYTQYPYWRPPDNPADCIDDMTPPLTPEKFCALNKGSHIPVAWEFFRQSRTAPDQLRLRMAHAWHEIFVVSQIPGAYAIAEYHQRLRDGAFGTFEDLLASYALSPQLGSFQSWAKNLPEHDGIHPNENFARELMQLMTIGVNALNEDGTKQLDAAGRLIPTYGQSDIQTLARVLTGFTYPTLPGNKPDWDNPRYYIGNMIPFDKFHDTGQKLALGGRLYLAPGGGAMDDVRATLKALVNHPNTPPFICKQLIQKTVTSSPTPEYIARVVAVFKDNGAGVRGDLAAVTRAILLDPEARGARKIDPEYGRLREPVLLWTAMIRGLDVTTDGWAPNVMADQSSQRLFSPDTVFSYFPADFTLIGGTVPGPEFGIYTTAEFLNRANQINDLLYAGWGPVGYVPNAVGTPSPLLLAFQPDGANADALVDRLNRLFLHGTMKADMRQTIVNAVNKIPSTQLLQRIKLAINLTLDSVDYQVQK